VSKASVMKTTDYNCQACGACCVSPNGAEAGYVGLGAGDARRIRRLGLPLVRHRGELLLGTVPYPGEGGERCCVALAGTVGESCACSIYADRPQACRQFQPGGLQCRVARHDAGLDEEPAELSACLATLKEPQRKTTYGD
jgi:Fe-S-cluster containining protein